MQTQTRIYIHTPRKHRNPYSNRTRSSVNWKPQHKKWERKCIKNDERILGKDFQAFLLHLQLVLAFSFRVRQGAHQGIPFGRGQQSDEIELSHGAGRKRKMMNESCEDPGFPVWLSTMD